MSDSLDVGSLKKGTFIAFPQERYDHAKTVLSNKKKHILLLSIEDTLWLIEVLQKEIKSQVKDYDPPTP